MGTQGTVRRARTARADYGIVWPCRGVNGGRGVQDNSDAESDCSNEKGEQKQKRKKKKQERRRDYSSSECSVSSAHSSVDRKRNRSKSDNNTNHDGTEDDKYSGKKERKSSKNYDEDDISNASCD